MDVTDYSVPIDELLTTVKTVIGEANVSSNDPDRDLRVDAVEVTLKAIATHTFGGGLDFRVPVIGWKVKVGAKHTDETTHRVTIAFTPKPGPRFELRGSDVEETLLQAITTIRAAITSAGTGSDPLDLDTAVIELNFAVTDQGTISVGAEGELVDQLVHTLKLGLKPA